MDLSEHIEAACFSEFRRINLEKDSHMFCSALSEEGKTFVTVSLAISNALKLGAVKPVLFVDLAPNRAGSSILTGQRDTKGLVDLLLGKESIDNCIMPTQVPNLFVLPYGSSISGFEQPLRYLHQLNSLIEEKRKDYLIYIDSVPIFTSSSGQFDPAEISKIVDNTFIVVLTGKTPREVVLRSKKDIEVCGSSVENIIMNDRFVKSFRSELGYYLSWLEKIPLVNHPVRYLRARLGIY